MAPISLGATATLFLTFASPGLSRSGGTRVVVPLTAAGWPPAPGPAPAAPGAVPDAAPETFDAAALGAALAAPLRLRPAAGRTQTAEATPVAAAPAPRPAEADQAGGGSGADAAGPRFVLRAVAIEGATVYGADELRPLYEELLDREIALDEIFALADAVTVRYRNDGYTLSRAIVPPQTIRDGAVRLTVIEGFVDKVRVEGDTRGRAGLFRAWGEKIKASRPLNVAVLERYSLLANDLPGATVRAVLKPSAETPGAADVIFEVAHQSVEAFGSVDNRAPATTGPLQAQASVTGNSLLGLYDRTTLTVSSASEREHSQFVGARHDQVLGSEGTALSLSASYSRSEPGDVLKDLGLLSESTEFGIEVAHPVIRSRDANLTISGGFTYREVDSEALSARLFRDRLSVASLGGRAAFTDPWNGRDAVTLRVHKGLGAFNASARGDPLLTRADGGGDFVKFTGSLSRIQHLGDGLSLYLATTGQYASTQLLASEEFALGGARFGRAYDPSEITGDHGAAVSAEIRYTDQPDIAILSYYQLYGFWDLGATWDIEAGAQPARRSAASAGLGLRFGISDRVNGQLELAKPLTRAVALEDDGTAARLFFRLSARF